MRHRPSPVTAARILLMALFGLGLLASPALARHGAPPVSLAQPAKTVAHVPVVEVPAIDASRRSAQVDEAARSAIGPHAKRLRIADGNTVAVTPQHDGVWQLLDDGSLLWRVRVLAAGATDLHLGFDQLLLPDGATLYVIGAGDHYEGPYSDADATDGQLWIPAVPGAEAAVELHLPAGSRPGDAALVLDYVGAGFRDLFRQNPAKSTGPGTAGACNVNVVCPLGQPYPDQIRAVAHYEFTTTVDGQRGTYICTGTLVNSVPANHRNLFLTAAHCVSSQAEALTMVLYWNYQSSQCAITTGWNLFDTQTGASLRAQRTDADFSLVELSQVPDPAWDVHYTGWDATDTVPAGTIGIHHPSGDVKKITAGPQPSSGDNCILATNGPVTHWIAGPYSQGVTEGGSSGSGLFAHADSDGGKLLIGTLSGGDSQCSTRLPNQPNSGTDCYGKLAAGWDGPAANARLRDWLDPANSGTRILQGINGAEPVPPAEPMPPIANRNAARSRAIGSHEHGMQHFPRAFDPRGRLR